MDPFTEQILTQYLSIPYKPLALEAVSHTIRVMDCMAFLWPGKEGQLAALLHDYARFLQNAGMRHASKSAGAVRPLLEAQGLGAEGVSSICTAIANHSDKSVVHDPFSEALKDADVLARHLEDPGYVHPRLASLKKKGIPF